MFPNSLKVLRGPGEGRATPQIEKVPLEVVGKWLDSLIYVLWIVAWKGVFKNKPVSSNYWTFLLKFVIEQTKNGDFSHFFC